MNDMFNKRKENVMWKRNLARLAISSWAIALAVSVVPIDSVMSDGSFGNPAPISEQTNSAGCCVECKAN
ncbi:MAG: hypothetical protein GFH27_549281n356 [Chloroflexi bacterium AL-W]|nr:hypothetical protein [Chloroflexi bacterium AL-N1]NOK66241.1 hypothetical protein [Chloroflexi bacterium AL-N10]NOK73122.1 hypothetical protein [Chloroflexi bacterium AL-N5]NOK80019.1 hypothetical protein [Chloroflexi bacterium AL-W]NOK88125.1 hypothetical protein [Chloroflexi bacterium AL-N15]